MGHNSAAPVIVGYTDTWWDFDFAGYDMKSNGEQIFYSVWLPCVSQSRKV